MLGAVIVITADLHRVGPVKVYDPDLLVAGMKGDLSSIRTYHGLVLAVSLRDRALSRMRLAEAELVGAVDVHDPDLSSSHITLEHDMPAIRSETAVGVARVVVGELLPVGSVIAHDTDLFIIPV